MTKKKRKKGKRRNPGKGPKFEREICGILSLWFTEGRRDDLFWRTAGSGSRATTRSKRKIRTFGSYGDIGAVDPLGLPLLDVFTISLKDGYRDTHASALLDKPNKGVFELEKWFAEIQAQHEQAGSISWLLIHKRKGRAAVVYIHDRIMTQLNFGVAPTICLFHVNSDIVKVVRLDDFLARVTPHVIKELSKRS